jgi:hypothetical protein
MNIKISTEIAKNEFGKYVYAIAVENVGTVLMLCLDLYSGDTHFESHLSYWVS